MTNDELTRLRTPQPLRNYEDTVRDAVFVFLDVYGRRVSAEFIAEHLKADLAVVTQVLKTDTRFKAQPWKRRIDGAKIIRWSVRNPSFHNATV